MKRNTAMNEALSSYQRDVRRLKSYSPDWKPISLKEYIQSYHKKSREKNLQA